MTRTRSTAVQVSLVAAVLLGAAIPSASAQTVDTLVTPPGNIMLANYNSVPLGPNAGLEGSSYVARVGDPSAVWLNPAGLSRAESAEVSGSSGLFQLATVSPSTLPDSGGAVRQLPSLVGFMATKLFGGWTVGLAALTPTSWSQRTDSQLLVDHGTGQERFVYSADSEFEQQVVAGSAGFSSGRWRFGGGLAFVHTSIDKNEMTSDRLAGATSLRSLVFDSRTSGSSLQLRPLFGAQYDVSPRLLIGAVIRTPAVTMMSSGSRITDALFENGGASLGASLFDADATYTNRLPFEVHGGIAFIRSRAQIEIDVHGYSGISSYAMFATDQPLVTYSTAAPGLAPAINTRDFGDQSSQSKAIANVSVGGHVLLTSNGIWRLHFGAGSDISPVGDEDQVFTRVDLYGWTLGLSGTKAGFEFTAGLNYRTGSSDDVIVRNLQNGERVQSGIDVRTLGFIYALAYKF